MWVTCYNCNGVGSIPIKKNDTIICETEDKEKICRICDKYRITEDYYQFYGQIWCEEDYEIITPPSSP